MALPSVLLVRDLYTPGTPTTTESPYNNADLNPLGSTYADDYSRDTTELIRKLIKATIYDAAPQQYMDLKILNIQERRQVTSDEFDYAEMGFGRSALTNAVIGAPIASGASQDLPCESVANISVDTIIVLEDNVKAVVTAINTGTSTITVKAKSGGTLAQIEAAAAGTYSWANLAPIEADGVNSISQYFRILPTTRYNFVQMVVKGMRFGKMELFKLEKNATYSNYLTMQKQRMIEQFRIDLSNIYWNGERGEFPLAETNTVAKAAGGVVPLMVDAGCMNESVTLANAPAALEDLALSTEYQAYGESRFLYATPRLIHYLSQQYKGELTRYTPDNDLAKLGLKGVDIGSTKIVFVPMKRFEEPSCFPKSFRNKMILIDQKSIIPVECWGEEMGETLMRKPNGNLATFQDHWVSGTFSIEYNNPLGGGMLNISNLP